MVASLITDLQQTSSTTRYKNIVILITSDTCHMTCYMWHMTHDRPHMTCSIWHMEGGEHSLNCEDGLGVNVFKDFFEKE